jgi:hypothetical protein
MTVGVRQIINGIMAHVKVDFIIGGICAYTYINNFELYEEVQAYA